MQLAEKLDWKGLDKMRKFTKCLNVVLFTFLRLKGLQRTGHVIRVDECPHQKLMGGDFVERKPVGEFLASW
jgi:hypothetical protein